MASHQELSPRAARTRAALISAGFDLLSVKPIDGIPIDEVVARAGVAKGSFFNHFTDKQAFAEAIAAEVRLQVEEQVTRANAGVIDPIERIATGMRVCAAFALSDPKRTLVLLRNHGSFTARAHPLNKGLVEDINAACAAGLLRSEARDGGVLFWLEDVGEHPEQRGVFYSTRESPVTLGLTAAERDADAVAQLSAGAHVLVERDGVQHIAEVVLLLAGDGDALDGGAVRQDVG